MAAPGPFVVENLPKLNYFSLTNLLAATATNFRLALVTSAWTPAPTTDELWATVSGNEIANGNGYTTGGGALSGVALSQTSGVVKFTSSAFVWTASGTGIPAWRYGVLYYLGTLNSKVNPLVAYFLGDATPADVPLTTSSNTLTFTPNAAGILTIS